MDEAVDVDAGRVDRRAAQGDEADVAALVEFVLQAARRFLMGSLEDLVVAGHGEIHGDDHFIF